MRRRWRMAAALSVTIGAGLLSRRWPLPGLFAEYTGDALYATAMWFAAALLWPRARGAALTAIAFAASALVECSQSIEAQWLAEVRATTIGRLLLGEVFQWPDLVAYAAGALLGAGVGHALCTATPPNERHGGDLA